MDVAVDVPPNYGAVCGCSLQSELQWIDEERVDEWARVKVIKVQGRGTTSADTIPDLIALLTLHTAQNNIVLFNNMG